MPWEAELSITHGSKLRGVCLYQITLGEIIELSVGLTHIAQNPEKQKLEGIIKIIIQAQETKAQGGEFVNPSSH